MLLGTHLSLSRPLTADSYEQFLSCLLLAKKWCLAPVYVPHGHQSRAPLVCVVWNPCPRVLLSTFHSIFPAWSCSDTKCPEGTVAGRDRPLEQQS
jgi:hypothetical protein